MDARHRSLHRWLEKVLAAPVGTLEPVSLDASFRRYFRVRDGALTRVVMDAPPAREDCASFVRIANLLSRTGVNVPEIVAKNLEEGFLLLGDLGDRTYLAALAEDNVERLYADAMSALLSIQALGECAALPAYDEGLLSAEMSLFPEWFLGRHLGIRLAASEQRTLRDCFALLGRSAAEQPQVFVHRDYHSRNLMYVAQHNPGILDFQDAVRGPVSYDLVSLLRDVYLRWPTPRVQGWVDSYHDRAVQTGILADYDRGRFRRWFDLMGVQRHLKVAGIFARLYHRDGKSGYLNDIPLTLDYLLGVSGHYPELAPLLDMLQHLQVVDRLRARAAPAERVDDTDAHHVADDG